MTGKDLITGISYVDEAFIQEAENQRSKGKNRMIWKAGRLWIAAAACFIAAAGGVTVWRLERRSLDLLPGGSGIDPVAGVILQREEGMKEEENDVMAAVTNLSEEEALPAAECLPEASVFTVDRSGIILNELKQLTQEDCAWYNPDQYSYVEWDEKDIEAYYGTGFEPAYIPEGLNESEYNRRAQAVYDSEGAIVKDTVTCKYYRAYDENGHPTAAQKDPQPKGFTMMISRLGKPGELLYVLPEEELQISDINGNDVIFGYRSESYGPYDPVTKEAAGCYDLFDISFEKDGIYYELVSSGLELDEVIKITASVLYGSGAIEVE